MTAIDEDLSRLEQDLRILKIEYEQFFGRGRSRPPSDTQWRVDNLIKRYAERTAEMGYGQRFRYNNLASTYAKYQEMWRKKMVELELGKPRHFGAAAKTIEAQRTSTARDSRVTASSAPAAIKSGFAMSFCDPQQESDRVEHLYRKLLAIREQAGETSAAPSLQDFEKFVLQKTKELKRKKGCEKVEYCVTTEGGRVKLKARVAG